MPTCCSLTLLQELGAWNSVLVNLSALWSGINGLWVTDEKTVAWKNCLGRDQSSVPYHLTVVGSSPLSLAVRNLST